MHADADRVLVRDASEDEEGGREIVAVTDSQDACAEVDAEVESLECALTLGELEGTFDALGVSDAAEDTLI